MRILWLDINASYSHSSLAIPALDAQLDKDVVNSHQWRVLSGTQKKDIAYYLDEIQLFNPDIILSTLWLFNHKYVVSILEKSKKSSPEILVVLGGPEFLGNNFQFLKRERFIDAVFRGEGEEIFPLFIKNCEEKDHWKDLKGFCYIDKNGEYCDNGIAIVENFAGLAPPETSPFFRWDKPFIQLECSRGCFNNCRFCVSGCDNTVRNIPSDDINRRLAHIRSKGIIDVRILDRTFNANQKRAVSLLSVFELFPEMRFHLEIHPSFLDNTLNERLASLPDSLLHIEAGVQSLNDNVLKECHRKGGAQKTLQGLGYLISLNKYEVHCDLIAGLPLYTYDNLIEDFICLLKLNPSEIQIELLKVLPGTDFNTNSHKYFLKYSADPPYQIEETAWITPLLLDRIVNLSRIVEMFFNGSIWRELFRDIILENKENIEHFITYITENEINFNINNVKKGVILYNFTKSYCIQFIEKVLLIWMKNGLSFKVFPGSLSNLWKYGDKPDNPLYKHKSTYNTYRYIETDNKRMWFLYNKNDNNFKSIKEFIEIL